MALHLERGLALGNWQHIGTPEMKPQNNRRDDGTESHDRNSDRNYVRTEDNQQKDSSSYQRKGLTRRP